MSIESCRRGRGSAHNRTGTVTVRACVLAASITFANERSASAEVPTWNQWNETGDSGVGQDHLRLTGGIGYGSRHGDVVLMGDFEYMLRDRVGLTGMTAATVFAPGGIPTVLPFLGGVNFHAFPKSAFDLTAGGRAGIALVLPVSTPEQPPGDISFAPRVDLVGGASFYFWGAFHMDAEAGYILLRTETGPLGRDLSGPLFAMKLGFYL